MTRTLLFFAVLCACGPATNSQSKAPALEHLSGQMALSSPGMQIDAPVHLAIAWFPTAAPTAGVPPAGIVTSEVEYQGTFPQSFTVDLTTLPPAAAIGFAQGVHYASGTLVAYEDLDGDGQLTVAHGTPVTDKVLAVTERSYALNPASLPVGQTMTAVFYTDGALMGAPAGYSQSTFTFHADGTFDSAILPIDTALNLTLKDDPALSLVACADAYVYSPTATTECGIRINTVPFVFGDAFIEADGSSTTLIDVRSGLMGSSITNSTVTVNDTAVPYDATTYMAYILNEPMAVVLHAGTNQLHVATPGFDDVTASFTVPTAFTITSPANGAMLHAGSQVTLEWTASTGAASYVPTVGAIKPPDSYTDTSYVFTVPMDMGPLYVDVTALGGVAFPTTVIGSTDASAIYQVVP